MAPRKKMDAPDDLSELDTAVNLQEAGRNVDLVNVDMRSPLGFGIQIAGPQSERAANAKDALTTEILGLGKTDPSEAERLTIQIHFLARVSLRFNGQAKMNGVLLQDEYEDFVKLYTRFAFIRQQIERAHYNGDSFLPPSGEGSSPESELQS